jgi:hypothetical protein
VGDLEILERVARGETLSPPGAPATSA